MKRFPAYLHWSGKQENKPQEIPSKFVLDKPTIIIGRSKEWDICIDHKHSVSRKHCKLQYSFENQQWYLTDCSSLYGTFINSERIKYPKTKSDALREGDVIIFRGNESGLEFQFSFQPESASDSIDILDLNAPEPEFSILEFLKSMTIKDVVRLCNFNEEEELLYLKALENISVPQLLTLPEEKFSNFLKFPFEKNSILFTVISQIKTVMKEQEVTLDLPPLVSTPTSLETPQIKTNDEPSQISTNESKSNKIENNQNEEFVDFFKLADDNKELNNNSVHDINPSTATTLVPKSTLEPISTSNSNMTPTPTNTLPSLLSVASTSKVNIPSKPKFSNNSEQKLAKPPVKVVDKDTVLFTKKSLPLDKPKTPILGDKISNVVLQPSTTKATDKSSSTTTKTLENIPKPTGKSLIPTKVPTTASEKPSTLTKTQEKAAKTPEKPSTITKTPEKAAKPNDKLLTTKALGKPSIPTKVPTTASEKPSTLTKTQEKAAQTPEKFSTVTKAADKSPSTSTEKPSTTSKISDKPVLKKSDTAYTSKSFDTKSDKPTSPKLNSTSSSEKTKNTTNKELKKSPKEKQSPETSSSKPLLNRTSKKRTIKDSEEELEEKEEEFVLEVNSQPTQTKKRKIHSIENLKIEGNIPFEKVGKFDLSDEIEPSAFLQPQGEEMVGLRVKVFWETMNEWYKGEVVRYNARVNEYKVHYDDGDITWEERDSLEILPEEEQTKKKKKRKH